MALWWSLQPHLAAACESPGTKDEMAAIQDNKLYAFINTEKYTL
jgi:hypothetical protein